MQSIVQLIADWAGFEELVAKLHETGTVNVQHDVTLVGKSGAPRQIDVLVTHTEGLYTHRILIECKHWKGAVKRAQIDAMATAMEDLNASKGVFFSTKGYQSGAETMAAASGIEIFVVREITDSEWGAPGRHVDFFLHIISRAVGNIAFPGARALVLDPAQPLPETLKLGAVAGAEGFESTTPVLVAGRRTTIESLLERASMSVLDKATAKSVTFNKGAECTVYMMGHAEFDFSPPLQMERGDSAVIICPRLECDVGVRVVQSRFQHDRGEKYLFALAVENCVTGAVYAAARATDAKLSTVHQLARGPESENPDALRNGSIMRVLLKSFFDFSELDGMTEIPAPPGLL